jgi:hypothetical protein
LMSLCEDFQMLISFSLQFFKVILLLFKLGQFFFDLP